MGAYIAIAKVVIEQGLRLYDFLKDKDNLTEEDLDKIKKINDEAQEQLQKQIDEIIEAKE